MTTGRSDLQRTLDVILSLDVAEIYIGRGTAAEGGLRRRLGDRCGGSAVLQEIDHLPDMRKCKYLQLLYDGRLGCVLARDDKP